MKVPELRKHAASLGIRNAKRMSKAELEAAVAEREDGIYNQPPKTINMDEMNIKQLREVGREYGLKPTTYPRAELIERIKSANKTLPIYNLVNTTITEEEKETLNCRELKKLIPRTASGKSACTKRKDLLELADKYATNSADTECELRKKLEANVSYDEFTPDELHMYAASVCIEDIGRKTREEILGEIRYLDENFEL